MATTANTATIATDLPIIFSSAFVDKIAKENGWTPTIKTMTPQSVEVATEAEATAKIEEIKGDETKSFGNVHQNDDGTFTLFYSEESEKPNISINEFAKKLIMGMAKEKFLIAKINEVRIPALKKIQEEEEVAKKEADAEAIEVVQ